MNMLETKVSVVMITLLVMLPLTCLVKLLLTPVSGRLDDMFPCVREKLRGARLEEVLLLLWVLHILSWALTGEFAICVWLEADSD